MSHISFTVTFLEQARPEHPDTPQRLPCILGQDVVLKPWQPDIDAYRDLYIRVGKPWLWWQRLVMSNQELAAILSDSMTELYALLHADTAVGFCEMTLNAAPATCNIDYFGLIPDYAQSGLGGALMRRMLARIWHDPTQPVRVTVNTCTLDHPRALGFYKHLGFREIRRQQHTIPDPRTIPELYGRHSCHEGSIPSSIQIADP